MTRTAGLPLAAVLTVALALCACGGSPSHNTTHIDVSQTIQEPAVAGVYVGGYECLSVWGEICMATYWKNGTIFHVGDSNALPVLTAMAVSGTDIYFAGFEIAGGSNGFTNVAKYWKNGIGVPLSDGTQRAQATGIAISDGDVYVVGFEGEPAPRWEGAPVAVAKYWKNGVPVPLTDGTKLADATTIVIANNDVYVAGSEGGEATYWKNGTAVRLGAGNAGSSWARSIAVSGADVHIAGGAMTLMPSGGSAGVAMYWKNGIPATLGIGDRSSDASSIVVSSGDVYISGGEVDRSGEGGQMIAMYWKNGAPVALGDRSTQTYAPSIAVDGSDVHIAIQETDALPGLSGTASRSDAKYWKNGTTVSLPHTSGMRYAEPFFIAVVH